MEAFFSWVGAAFGALFVVAVAVAWWEHLVRGARPPAPPEPPTPRAVSVDVQLDALPATAPAGAPGPVVPATVTDALQRRVALDGAMSRMARPSLDGSVWTETSPMVLHAPPDDAASPAARPGAAAPLEKAPTRA